MRRIELPAGIELDREGGTIVVEGLRVPVGNAMLSEPTVITETVRLVDGEIVRRPRPMSEWVEMPLSIHATLLVGENGHWVDLALWPGWVDRYGPPTMSAGLPDGAMPYGLDPTEECDAAWVTHLLLTARERTDPPPNPFEPDWMDPFAGCIPGSWLGFDWLDEEDG